MVRAAPAKAAGRIFCRRVGRRFAAGASFDFGDFVESDYLIKRNAVNGGEGRLAGRALLITPSLLVSLSYQILQ